MIFIFNNDQNTKHLLDKDFLSIVNLRIISIYFSLTSIYIHMDEINRIHEIKSGTTETGVSQKDLQITNSVMSW